MSACESSLAVAFCRLRRRHYYGIKPRRDAEHGSCLLRGAKLLDSEDRAGANYRLGHFALDRGDRSGGGLGAESHLEDRKPALHERLRERDCLLLLFDNDYRDYPRRLECFNDIHDVCLLSFFVPQFLCALCVLCG